MPALSVIIPTLNQKGLLRGCLENLLRQSRKPEQILVVDNGSSDGTADMIREHFAGAVRVAREERRGVDRARNRGIAEASGDVVVFTDGDILPPPHWLEALESCFQDPSVAAAGGPVFPLWLGRPPEALRRSRRAVALLGNVDYGTERRRLDPDAECLVGGNFACRKGFVAGRNGFRGVFPYPGMGVCGEDYELSRRLARQHLVLYEPSAYVYHRIPAEKTKPLNLLKRASYFEAAGVQLGTKFKPKRGLVELLGFEGCISAAAILGRLYGHLRFKPDLPDPFIQA